MVDETSDWDLIDHLAALEHRQWMNWAAYMMQNESISDERVDHWQDLMIPFVKLSEEQQDNDREYAEPVERITTAE